jgi:hypothetical protein
VKEIHTHKGPSDKSLFFHKASAVKSTLPTPSLFHQENATVKYQFSNYNGNIYWHLYFPLFHFSVSWCTSTQYSTHQTPTPCDSDHDSWFKHLHCLLYCMFLLWQGIDLIGELEIDISMNIQLKKKTMKKSLQQKGGHLPLVPYCTKQRNKCAYAFLSSCIDCV